MVVPFNKTNLFLVWDGSDITVKLQATGIWLLKVMVSFVLIYLTVTLNG